MQFLQHARSINWGPSELPAARPMVRSCSSAVVLAACDHPVHATMKTQSLQSLILAHSGAVDIKNAGAGQASVSAWPLFTLLLL